MTHPLSLTVLDGGASSRVVLDLCGDARGWTLATSTGACAEGDWATLDALRGSGGPHRVLVADATVETILEAMR